MRAKPGTSLTQMGVPVPVIVWLPSTAVDDCTLSVALSGPDVFGFICAVIMQLLPADTIWPLQPSLVMANEPPPPLNEEAAS